MNTESRVPKTIKILEITWLVVAIASILVGAYETQVKGIEKSYMFFIFTCVAGIMYALRRRQRINLEKENEG